MKKISCPLLMLLSLMIGLSCTIMRSPQTPARPKPRWVDELPPRPGYYQGVGCSSQTENHDESMRSAEEDARLALARNIKSIVKEVYVTRVWVLRRVQNAINQEFFEQETERESRRIVTQTLTESSIQERWYNPETKEYWAYAVVEKSKVAEVIQEEIEKVKKLALTKVLVKIREHNLGELSDHSLIEEELVKRVIGKGYTVLHQNLPTKDISAILNGDARIAQEIGKRLKVKILIVGQVYTQYIGTSAIMKNVRCCDADGIILAVDIDAGRILANVSLSQMTVKGYGKTKEAAGIEALKKASLKVADQIIEDLESIDLSRYMLRAQKLIQTAIPETADSDTQEQVLPSIEAEEAVSEEIVETTVPQKWAVIVGVSDYRDTRIPALRYSARDAQTFCDWLVSPQGGKYAPANVKLLINENATLYNIKEALFTWLKQAIEEDMVLIYFSGHGSPESPDSLENLFLLPYDSDYDAIGVTGFPMWDIETALKRFISAKKVVVIADACHAGGIGAEFLRTRRGMIVKPRINSALHNLAKVGDGVAVITASDDKQLSLEGQQWGGGHGVFTWFLLKGLEGEADYSGDGNVTLGELIPYVSEQVRRETRNSQCPTVAGRFDPALTIGR